MLGHRHHVAGPRGLEERGPAPGVEPRGGELGDEVLVAEGRLGAEGGHVVGELLRVALVHVPRVPLVAEGRHRVDAPVDEDPELAVHVPGRRLELLEGGPAGGEGAARRHRLDLGDRGRDLRVGRSRVRGQESQDERRGASTALRGLHRWNLRADSRPGMRLLDYAAHGGYPLRSRPRLGRSLRDPSPRHRRAASPGPALLGVEPPEAGGGRRPGHPRARPVSRPRAAGPRPHGVRLRVVHGAPGQPLRDLRAA